MTAKIEYQNYHYETDKDHVVWLTVDRKDASVNTLNRQMFEELNVILDRVQIEKPVGLIILSGKTKGFIAGADIKQFLHFNNEQEAFDLIRQAQLVLDKLAALNIPTVAMINGFCLGGGFELALACRYRIAEDSAATIIGLPEIKLGIHPGWGGTVRLPQLVGPLTAMKMILPGDAYPAKKAAKLKMIDEAVPLRQLKRAAKYYAINQPKPQKPGILASLSQIIFVRQLIGKMLLQNLAHKNVLEKHYPAPYAVVKNWMRDGAQGEAAMLNEAKSIAALMLTPTAHNLVRLFFLQERLKGLAKSKFRVQHVHVIGAGTMGGDIAAWCALKGMQVTLQDQTPEKIAPAIKRAYQLFSKKLKEPRLIQAAMDRLQPDVAGLGVKQADVVIEAIFENLAAKQALFSALEPQLKESALLATNTSSLPLQEISQSLKNPERLVGIHFFNPVAKMLLVEVVQAPNTAQAVVEQATAFVGQIGRLPLPVASQPGFLVNRILMPYLLEAMSLYEEGVSAQAIDEAAIQFGMPMGPVTLADIVGLDVCLSVAENLAGHFGGKVPQRLREMVAAGHLGIKTGQGFYQYNKKGKPTPLAPLKKTENPANSDIGERLILRMLNEAIACLHDKVVADGDLLDAGMVFGVGFAPFRGGPIQYIKTQTPLAIVAKLEQFSREYGERFKPGPGWKFFADESRVTAESLDYATQNS